MKYSKSEQAEALASLRDILKPGDTVHTILRHVSRSGMQRVITPVKVVDGDHRFLTWAVARVSGMSIKDGMSDGVVVGGAGMDMGFHLVYELSYRLFPNGYGCIGEKCPSNDHTNGDRDHTPHTGPMTRCRLCLDVPGKDGRGHVCKGCNGAGEIEDTFNRDHWHKDGGYALRQRWL